METWIGTMLGWMGTVGTFVAYVLMLRGTWSPSTRSYLALNAAGGLLAAGGALAYGAWPSFASNIVWGVMGAYGLFATFRRRHDAIRTEPSSAPASPGSATAPVTVPLPVLPMPQSPWDPSDTLAAPISLPWLPRSEAPQRDRGIAPSGAGTAALAA
ncbi:hypothetical protein ACWGOE_09515 [Leucobacter chromiiresistens]